MQIVSLDEPVADGVAFEHLVAQLARDLRQPLQHAKVFLLRLHRIVEVVPHLDVVVVQRGDCADPAGFDVGEQLRGDVCDGAAHGSCSC